MTPAARPATLPRAIDAAAGREPEREAARFGSRGITYAELVRRSSALARLLLDAGVKPGERVGVLLEKSLESVVSLYGIMRTGAAYVPLDPAAPPARLAFLLRDCGIRHLVTHRPRRAKLESVLAEGATLDHVIGLGDGGPAPGPAWDDVIALDAGVVDRGRGSGDLAYVIYTSGSTGAPKGIMHTHASSLAFCAQSVERYGLVPQDRFSNQAPLHFDMSIFDIFAAGLAGATTVVMSEGHAKLPASQSQLLAAERISVFFSVPFALAQLATRGALETRDLSALRWVIFGGEPMPTPHLRTLMQALPRARFNNMYGPAEVNGCVCYDVSEVPHPDEPPVPIGREYGTTRGRIVDGDDAEVADGEMGELLIAGTSRMRGYWNRPDLDERAFCTPPGEVDVFYRTGDMAVRAPDGNLLFHGRRDRQVKVRGYRVELDEVETATLAHPAIEEAGVYAARRGDLLEIIAAVQPRDNATVDAAMLAQHLRAHLPAYARPARIDIVDGYPRTSSGKIDYLALRAHEEATDTP